MTKQFWLLGNVKAVWEYVAQKMELTFKGNEFNIFVVWCAFLPSLKRFIYAFFFKNRNKTVLFYFNIFRCTSPSMMLRLQCSTTQVRPAAFMLVLAVPNGLGEKIQKSHVESVCSKKM